MRLFFSGSVCAKTTHIIAVSPNTNCASCTAPVLIPLIPQGALRISGEAKVLQNVFISIQLSNLLQRYRQIRSAQTLSLWCKRFSLLYPATQLPKAFPHFQISLPGSDTPKLNFISSINISWKFNIWTSTLTDCPFSFTVGQLLYIQHSSWTIYTENITVAGRSFSAHNGWMLFVGNPKAAYGFRQPLFPPKWQHGQISVLLYISPAVLTNLARLRPVLFIFAAELPLHY